MTLAEDNLRIATLKAVVDAVTDEMAKLRAKHTTQLIERYDEEGTSSFKVKLPDGTVVAAINLKVPKKASAVTDEERFLAWVEANHPDAIETRVIPAEPEQVIPAKPEQTLKSVSGKRMAELEKQFDLTDEGVVDTATGTIVDGMVVVPAAAPKSFEVRYETGGAGGRADLALAYRAGKLNHVLAGTTLPAIEAQPAVERRLAVVQPDVVRGETVANRVYLDPMDDGDEPTVEDQVQRDLEQEFPEYDEPTADEPIGDDALVESQRVRPAPTDDFDPGDWDDKPGQTLYDASGW